jgi:putative AlgH/UPF0301 family transcriptional regulator
MPRQRHPVVPMTPHLLLQLLPCLLLSLVCHSTSAWTSRSHAVRDATVRQSTLFHRRRNADDVDASSIRFLGKGPHAMVRPGVVLVAPANEFHHFYRQAAIFIYSIDEDNDDDDDTTLIRGVILDHPTPFTAAEMMDESYSLQNNHPLASLLLFRGGDKGDARLTVLHTRHELGLPCIGTTGIHVGGWTALVQAFGTTTTTNTAEGQCKLFFGHCEFTANELASMLDPIDASTGDAWMSVEMDASLILNADYDRGDCWKRIRNVLQQQQEQPKE